MLGVALQGYLRTSQFRTRTEHYQKCGLLCMCSGSSTMSNAAQGHVRTQSRIDYPLDPLCRHWRGAAGRSGSTPRIRACQRRPVSSQRLSLMTCKLGASISGKHHSLWQVYLLWPRCKFWSGPMLWSAAVEPSLRIQYQGSAEKKHVTCVGSTFKS